jgi:hypothetical protein
MRQMWDIPLRVGMESVEFGLRNTEITMTDNRHYKEKT